MASMEELYNTIADIWDSYDIYRQEHADKYGEAEESPSTRDHFNKTITIDDCIFEEPYEQELRQYL